MPLMPKWVARDELLAATKPLYDLIGLSPMETLKITIKGDAVEIIAAAVDQEGRPHDESLSMTLEEGDARESSVLCYTAHIEVLDVVSPDGEEAADVETV